MKRIFVTFIFLAQLIISNAQDDPYKGWEQLNYKTGDTIECENITPAYDFSLNNFLKVNVGANTDVVIKLMEISGQSDKCIRSVYIRSGDTYKIKNVPAGKYYLKIAYGKDYRKKTVDNQCYHKFMQNVLYEKGKDILDFNLIKQPDQKIGNQVKKSWSVPSYELFLDVTSSDSQNVFDSENINEEEFNR